MNFSRRHLRLSTAAACAGQAAGCTRRPADSPGIGVIGIRYKGAVIAAQAKLHGRIVGIADVELGHRSVSACHPGNISCKLGRPLQWDPAAERFVGDAEADGLLSRPQRPGFEVRA